MSVRVFTFAPMFVYTCEATIKTRIELKVRVTRPFSKTDQDKNCNCRDPSLCPLDKKCLRKNVVYEATVQHGGISQKYVGMTENTFKTRYNQHKTSFKHAKNRNQTELSNLIWKLKDKNIDYRLTWRLIAQAQTYKPGETEREREKDMGVRKKKETGMGERTREKIERETGCERER